MPQFQSTPVIADGRINFVMVISSLPESFQSTPVIADGRILQASAVLREAAQFQSTPVIADGRIFTGQIGALYHIGVSIHARHC